MTKQQERTWRHDLREDCAEFGSDVTRTSVHILVVYVVMHDGLHVTFDSSMVTGFTIAAVRVFDADTRYFTRIIGRVLKRDSIKIEDTIE